MQVRAFVTQHNVNFVANQLGWIAPSVEEVSQYIHVDLAQSYGTNDPQISNHVQQENPSILGVDNFEPQPHGDYLYPLIN